MNDLKKQLDALPVDSVAIITLDAYATDTLNAYRTSLEDMLGSSGEGIDVWNIADYFHALNTEEIDAGSHWAFPYSAKSKDILYGIDLA